MEHSESAMYGGILLGSRYTADIYILCHDRRRHDRLAVPLKQLTEDCRASVMSW